MNEPITVGRVLGTDDSTPLEYWVAVQEGAFLQLDDAVVVRRTVPERAEEIEIFGVVSDMRVRHEGTKFDSDVFLVARGILPAQATEAALVLTTRFEPEVFVPPIPGEVVYRAAGKERERALFFDGMKRRVPAGLSRDGEMVYVNMEFMDGTRGAHINISGISGVATKTSYAVFLLHSIFRSGVLSTQAANTKALIFNVKGDDLLFLDRRNRRLDAEAGEQYQKLGLPAEPFESVELWAPPMKGVDSLAPATTSRDDGVKSFFWTLSEFCRDELLPFLFADADDERQQYTIIIQNVADRLRRDAKGADDGGVRLDGTHYRTLTDLVKAIEERLNPDNHEQSQRWAGTKMGAGTINAFIRRLASAAKDVADIVRGGVSNPEAHRIARQRQVTVVDIGKLSGKAQRFVVGAVLRKAFLEKERAGSRTPLLFVVLDELNKYAPRQGRSPIKEILLDIAERGRSLGIILVGAQQTASEVERRIIANASIRVVGRLDSAESKSPEYAFLPSAQRQRATISKPGTMILAQPELPVPVVLNFPFPAWATRPDEAEQPERDGPEIDPFDIT